MHGKNDIKNTGHTNIIFKKNKDGTYTKNAPLCQDILQYCINGKYKEDDNESFRLWYLTKRLLEVNTEFINHFKDPSTWNMNKNSRIENRLPRVKRNVIELVKLGLIKQVRTEKETRGTGTVDIFQFTSLGRVMAWVVESMNPDKREYAENQIYDLFQNHYKKEPSSIDIFCSIYYRKCKERGLFGDLVEHYRKVAGAPALLLGRQGFSRHLMMVPTHNMERDINFWILWNDSVMELEPDTRERMFHHLKLEIESKAQEACQAFGAFERLRYKTKDNPEFVTIEGQCKNCKLYTPATFWLNEYLHEVFKAYPNEVIVGKQCPACKNDDSLEFSIIL